MEGKQNSRGHETTDASVRGIVYSGAGLALLCTLAGLLVYGIFKYLADHPLASSSVNPMVETGPAQFPPGPRIEDRPAMEVQDLHASEDKILSTYGWANKKAGTVRIPIDRAMEIQLQRGFPVRKEAPAK